MSKELEQLRKLNFNLPFELDDVQPECHVCILNQIKKYTKYVDNEGNSAENKFLVPCHGILKDPIDPLLKPNFDEETWDELQAASDIVKWAARYLTLPTKEAWIARWYQEQILRCTSSRKMLRIARRTGKTDLVCIEICYYLFTRENIKLVVAGPQKTHTEEIITRVRAFIQSNPELLKCVTRDVSAPFYEIKLSNGSRLRGFAAGAKGKGGEGVSIRGQDADRLYLEEMDYVDERAITGAVLPLLATSPHTSLIGFSTPSGLRTPYYKLCQENPYYKEFHHNYKVLDHWKLVEMEKPNYTEEQWTHEYLAEFGTSESGVYKPSYIDRALTGYTYDEHSPSSGWRYCIGTDWNEKHGTEIVVLGHNPFSTRFQVVETLHIEKSEFTQLDGVNTLLQMVKKWKPAFVYIDAGNGCLHEDSFVYTNCGVRKIKDIIVGDFVLSHNGVFKEVLDMVATGTKNSYMVKPAFCLPIKASENHNHIVYRSQDRFNDFNNIKSTTEFCSSDFDLREYTTAELDKEKDFVIVPKQNIYNAVTSYIVDLAEELKDIPNIKYDENYIWTKHGFNTTPIVSISKIMQKYNVSRSTVQRTKRKLKNGDKFTATERRLAKQLFLDYGSEWYEFNYKKINRYIDILNPDFLNLYGWYLSEGHAGQNNIEICQMPHHYQNQFENLISYCSKNWDINVITKPNGLVRLFILSSLLTEFFKKIGGSHCHDKFIDQRILNNNGIELLPSLFWGDGHEHIHGVNLSMTSITLVTQVRQMLINNGLLSGLHYIKPRKRDDDYRSLPQLMLFLNANKDNATKINKILKTNIKARDGVFRRKYFEIDDCFLVPIKRIEPIGLIEKMYDLTIDGDASFCVNGFATHNSTNYEVLRKAAQKQRHAGGDKEVAKLLKTLKKYDSGAAIETRDPITKQKQRKPAKAFMVNASVRMFEQNQVIISTHDDLLEKQFRNYIIERYTPNGNPVYGLNEQRIGDHRLDAFNLAAVAFHLEFDDLHTTNDYCTDVAVLPDPRTLNPPRNFREADTNQQHSPAERRLENNDVNNLSSNVLFPTVPARLDNQIGQQIKTSRLGWDRDEEDLKMQEFLQRRRGRKGRTNNRPQRSTF